MVGHEQKQIRPQQQFLLPMAHGFEQRFRNVSQGELVFPALQAIDSDEINLLARIDLQRDVVWQ